MLKLSRWGVIASLLTGALTATIPGSHLAAKPDPDIVRRQATPTTTLTPDPGCTNGPNTRACWRDGFSIATDFDAKAPPAGKEVYYKLVITNTTAAPDGIERLAMLINGSYPGPTIIANWGDTLVIDVENQLANNGTGIHWHGIRQLNSNQHDGANGASECPIAPRETRRYRFKCTQFGTSWYHSHYSAQYGDGVVGTIIINGPATANYAEDLGTLPITDWFHTPAMELNEVAQLSRIGPPQPQNVLVNGSMVNRDGGGKYTKIKVTKGKTYRLRLINTSVDSYFRVSLDNHPYQVITSDFVPIKPYVSTGVLLAIGQRYDIVFTANQTVDNYWIRVTPAAACSANNMTNSGKVIGAILSYDTAPDAEPQSTPYTLPTSCNEETGLVPYVTNAVPEDEFDGAVKEFDLTSDQSAQTDNLFRWFINGSTIDVGWDKPTLQYILEGNAGYPERFNAYEMTVANKWYFWVIQTVTRVAIPHPIHLHGHDFYILGSLAQSTFDPAVHKSTLNFNNPTRRDVTTLPAGGWLALAFPADNPGAWLMHCHIAWHASQGLSLQFVERASEVAAAIGNVDEFNKGCQAWNTWWDSGTRVYNKTDSGI